MCLVSGILFKSSGSRSLLLKSRAITCSCSVFHADPQAEGKRAALRGLCAIRKMLLTFIILLPKKATTTLFTASVSNVCEQNVDISSRHSLWRNTLLKAATTTWYKLAICYKRFASEYYSPRPLSLFFLLQLSK